MASAVELSICISSLLTWLFLIAWMCLFTCMYHLRLSWKARGRETQLQSLNHSLVRALFCQVKRRIQGHTRAKAVYCRSPSYN
jgi:hypothetical protein